MNPKVSIYGKSYHGRHAEKRKLDMLYQSSMIDSQALYIRGYSGTGKTSLVESMDWESEKQCYFVSGRFDQQHMTRPYAAIAEALSALAAKWASSPRGIKEIQDFLKENSRDELILQILLPKLYHMSNTQLSMNENEPPSEDDFGNNRHGFQRLRSVVFKILERVTNNDRPVVILFNDMQWAEQPSLDLIQFLIEENLSGLFIVSTYRSEEVGENHILRSHSRNLIRSKRITERFHQMELVGFDLEELNDIFSKLTNKNPTATMPLVKVIHAKTLGNPFFVEQFFHLLQSEGYLKFSFLSCEWEWGDVNEIQHAMSIVSSEVADVVADSMRSLDKTTQEILKVAACLGAQIPLHVLKKYFAGLKQPDEETKMDLSNLEDILDEQVATQVLKRSSDSSLYFWAHDKLNQAALSLLPKEEQEALHLRLGNLVVRMSNEETTAVRKDILIYIAADQLNRVSLEVLRSEGEAMILDLVRLNLQAAKLSITKSAFYPAAELLRKGIDLMKSMKENSTYDRKRASTIWYKHHDLWLDLFNNLLEVEYIVGNHAGATHAVDEVLRNSRSLEEEFRAQSCLLEIMTNGKDRDYDGAIDLCVRILRSYNVAMPRNPSKIQVAMERRRFNKSLPTGKFQDLLRLPVAKSSREQCISEILAKLCHFAMLSGNLKVTQFSGLRAMRHANDHGLTVYTTMALLSYAISLRQKGKDELAYEYGELSDALLKQLSTTSTDNYAKMLAIIHSSTMPLKKPFQDSLEPFTESYRVGMKTGDVEFAFIAAMSYGYHYWFCGLPLAPLAQDMESYGQEARQFGLTPSIVVQFPIMLQSAMNLQGKSPSPTRLSGDAMNQKSLLQEVTGKQASNTFRDICTFRLMLGYIFRDLALIREMLDQLAVFPVFNPNIARSHLRQAFSGLGAFLLHRHNDQKKWLNLANNSLKYFHDAVKQGSMNAYPIYKLLLAEKTQTKKNYDEAIRVCSRSGLLNFEAIANENVGIYFETQKDKDWATHYVTRSLTLYEEWGAIGKAEAMRESHQHLLVSSEEGRMRERRSGTTRHGRSNFRKSIATKIRSLSFESQRHVFRRSFTARSQPTKATSSIHSRSEPLAVFQETIEEEEPDQ